jgi:hypothetical protein
MIVKRVVFILGLTVLFGTALSLPAMAQGVGAIGGTVLDGTGGVLPGATLTLSNPGAIGDNLSTVTDAQGKYQFPRVVPGTYSVKGELSGFQTVVQANIVVNADRTSRADLTMSVGNMAETITVAGEAPLLDTTSAAKQAVLSRQVLDQLPTGADIWSIARLTPGINLSKIDVGGTQMIAQSTAFSHGSTQQENEVMMDGMSLSHYSSGTGGSVNYYLDSFQAQEMNYVTGSTSAERAAGGVIINVITKTGANTFEGAGMYDGSSQSLIANNLTPTLRTQLLAGVPAAALAANPNIIPGGDIKLLFDSAFSMSGPIVKDRVWFFGHEKLGKANQYAVGSYNSDGTQLLSDNTLLDGLAKVSWAPTKNQQLHYFYTKQLKGRYHVAGGPTVTQFFDTAASGYNPSKNTVNVGRWTDVMSSRMVLDAGAESMNGQTNTLPQPQVAPNAIPRFDSTLRTNTVASATYAINNGWRANVTSSLSIVAGSHDVKLGYQVYQTRSVSGGTATVGYRAVYANGVPTSVNTYNTPTKAIERSRDHGVYLQDKWALSRKLTLNLGVRFQTGHGWMDKTTLCQVGTEFIAGQCFSQPTGVPVWKQVMPRTSVIYDPFGNGKTALKFTANRYYIPEGVIIVGRVDPIKIASDSRPWTVCAAGQTSGCDLNGDKIATQNEFGPSGGFALGTANRYAPNLQQPYTNEMNAEIQQQLPGSLVVSVGYYYRAQRNLIGSRNVAVPASGYIPLQVTEVTSGRAVTVYNQDPATLSKFDVLWSNEPELNRTFNGVDVTAQKRMSNGWMAIGSVSWGKADDFIYADSTDLNNPNVAFRRGPDSTDRPLTAKLSGAYELPYGLTVAGTSQYFKGWPITQTVLVSSTTVRLTQVSQSIVMAPAGTTRLPNITEIDMNVQRNIRFGKFRLSPRVDVFNLFNVAGITSEVTQLGPSYGNAISIIGGRLIKFGVNVNW